MRTLLFFTASWCDPCKRIAPVIDDIFSDPDLHKFYSGVERVDVDIDPIRAAKNRVNGLPTFIIVNENNEEVARHEGIWSGVYMRNKIIDWLRENSG